MIGTAARLTPCLSKRDKWAVGLCSTHILIRYYNRLRIEIHELPHVSNRLRSSAKFINSFSLYFFFNRVTFLRFFDFGNSRETHVKSAKPSKSYWTEDHPFIFRFPRGNFERLIANRWNIHRKYSMKIWVTLGTIMILCVLRVFRHGYSPNISVFVERLIRFLCLYLFSLLTCENQRF